MTTLTEKIGELIANGEIQEAIHQLKNLLQNSPRLNYVLLQSARLSDIHKQIQLGIIDLKDATLTKNQINFALIELLREIDNNVQSDPVLQKEVDTYAAQTIINITQKSTGSGDNIGRDKIGGNKIGKIGGDYIDGNKIDGDYIVGDKVMGDKIEKKVSNTFNLKIPMIIDSITHFFGDLIQLLSRPIHFIQNTLYNEQETPALIKGLLFYLIASSFAFILKVLTPNVIGLSDTNPPELKFSFINGLNALLNISAFIFFIFLVVGIWKLLRHPFQVAKTTVIVSYIVGSVTLLSSLGLLISTHVALIDPRVSVFHKNALPKLQQMQVQMQEGARNMLGDKTAVNFNITEEEFATLNQEMAQMQEEANIVLSSPIHKTGVYLNYILLALIGYWCFRMWRIYREEDATMSPTIWYTSVVLAFFAYNISNFIPDMVNLGTSMQKIVTDDSPSSPSPIAPPQDNVKKNIPNPPTTQDTKLMPLELDRSFFIGKWRDENSVLTFSTNGEMTCNWDDGNSNSGTWEYSNNRLTLRYVTGDVSTNVILRHAPKQFKYKELESNTEFNARKIDTQSSSTQEPVITEGINAIVTNQSGLNMRDQPTLNGSKVITEIPLGATVKIIQLGNQDIINGNSNFWVLVEYYGNRGWVWGHWLELNGN